ncbi:unnamed protein product [Mytilus coruscus]|uniref:Uncharacterized protein n=1 Tax=Mytilus coruscus TaxID=42192 RepID=A0A6J8CP77_MYTCO|nr:unnamed protein product [Mytilus coruscus]
MNECSPKRIKKTRNKERHRGKSKIPVTHNQRNHNILESAKRYFPIMEQSYKMNRLIDPSHIKNSRRQAPNFKKILTKALFRSEDLKDVIKCGDLRCRTCDYIHEGDNICVISGKIFKLNSIIRIESLNLIPTYNEFLVGETERLIARVILPNAAEAIESDEEEKCFSSGALGTGNPDSLFAAIHFKKKVTKSEKAATAPNPESYTEESKTALKERPDSIITSNIQPQPFEFLPKGTVNNGGTFNFVFGSNDWDPNNKQKENRSPPKLKRRRAFVIYSDSE